MVRAKMGIVRGDVAYAQDEVNQAESKPELTERRGELIPQVMHI